MQNILNGLNKIFINQKEIGKDWRNDRSHSKDREGVEVK